jgi:hypothetical protein
MKNNFLYILKKIKNNMKEEILTRYYVGLLIISFLSLFLFVGLLNSILYAVIITVVKYLFDKYIMSKMNPYIDKLIAWIKYKILKTT